MARDTIQILREEIEALKKRIEQLESRPEPFNPFKPIGPPPGVPPWGKEPPPQVPWIQRTLEPYKGPMPINDRRCHCGDQCRPGHCINVPA